MISLVLIGDGESKILAIELREDYVGIREAGGLIARVERADPLWQPICELQARYAKAAAYPRISTFVTTDGSGRKTWRTDTSEADDLATEAVRVVYEARCA